MSKNNTRLSIPVDECRGYAIYDDYAPLIFINAKDTSSKGKIFTLLHELAHILLKHNGVSSYNFDQKVEYQCNEIAGEILMPTQDFIIKWKTLDSIESNIDNLKSSFPLASKLAMATKALLKNLINKEEYDDFKKSQVSYYDKPKNKSKGGNSCNNIRASNGSEFARTVIIDTLNGHETYKDALNLLDIGTNLFLMNWLKDWG